MLNSSRRRPRRKLRPAAGSKTPFRFINTVLRPVFLSSLALLVWAWGNKDELPSADFYHQELLTEPLQTQTTEKPFQVASNGIIYTIEPVAEYELNGIVVSFHDSDAFSDIYHHKDWKDFINIRDLCVIWGGNVSSEVYKDLEFDNTTWTCWVRWPDSETGNRFSMNQLSNNHVLTNDPQVQHVIMSARPGDQIRFSGILARYSHDQGSFRRGTSTVRTDTGNGACETVFVRNFQVVKAANRKWRQVYAVSKWVAIFSFMGLVAVFFLGPVRRPKI